MSVSSEFSLGKRRSRFFFWLGVLVLPIFWSWFTLAKRFSSTERTLAFGWLVLYTTWIVSRWHSMQAHAELVVTGWPLVMWFVTLALCAWLFVRLHPTARWLNHWLEFVGMGVAIGPYIFQVFFLQIGSVYQAGPSSPVWLLLPLLPIALHLWIRPCKAWQLKSGRKSQASHRGR